MSASVEAFLNKLHHPMLAQIDLSLDRMRRLLSMVGSPEKRLPPVVHVAGTNGKGSLLAYLRAILEQAGYKVHRYTSPHLVHFRERIVLAGKEIDNDYMVSLCKHLAPILTSQPATFFEATTALAFLAFAEHKADVLLLETGMGGRLDATNVIDRPLLTAITPVSFDHTEYLGDTIEKIAQEKAGILKKAVSCVVGRQLAAALSVIERRAAELAAPLYRMGREWTHEGGRYQSATRTIIFTPSLAGSFQYDNAATAIACVDQLAGFTIRDAHVVQGIAAAAWPARLQNITSQFARFVPPKVEVWLDGGHNPQGGEALGEWLRASGKSVSLICGMSKGKDTKAYLAPIAPHVHKFYAIAIPGEANSQSAEQIAQVAAGLSIAAEAKPSFEKALQSALLDAKTPSMIVICGSLYLAGKILANLERQGHAGA